jgi:hypothetical protein
VQQHRTIVFRAIYIARGGQRARFQDLGKGFAGNNVGRFAPEYLQDAFFQSQIPVSCATEWNCRKRFLEMQKNIVKRFKDKVL